MIDVFKDELLSLVNLPDLIPASRPGKKIAVETVTRWAKKGVAGVVLETTQVGGVRYTTRSAFSVFCSEVARAKSERAAVAAAPELAASARAASAELEGLGW